MFAHKLRDACFTLCDRRDRRGGDQHHALLDPSAPAAKLWRRVPMFAIGLLLAAHRITLASPAQCPALRLHLNGDPV